MPKVINKAIKTSPYHIAIIMDGNGRWAKKHNLPRIMGHREGIKAVEKILSCSPKLGVKILTLYVFSSENWRRPKGEIDALMRLLARYLKTESKKLIDKDIKLLTIGDTSALPKLVKTRLDELIKKTSKNNALTLVLAINYGSRNEILRAVKRIASQVKLGKMKTGDINEEAFSKFLYTSKLSDPDLLIRTSGEFRLSNFLLWQSSYAEIYISNKLWPDFNEDDLKKAIEEYKNRERRFGDTKG